jgi:hypothetical protein
MNHSHKTSLVHKLLSNKIINNTYFCKIELTIKNESEKDLNEFFIRDKILNNQAVKLKYVVIKNSQSGLIPVTKICKDYLIDPKKSVLYKCDVVTIVYKLIILLNHSTNYRSCVTIGRKCEKYNKSCFLLKTNSVCVLDSTNFIFLFKSPQTGINKPKIIEVLLNGTDTGVSIAFPCFSFCLPETEFLYNITQTNIPEKYRHELDLPYSFELSGSKKVFLYIYSDGHIMLGGEFLQPLDKGKYDIYLNIVGYALSNNAPPL